MTTPTPQDASPDPGHDPVASADAQAQAEADLHEQLIDPGPTVLNTSSNGADNGLNRCPSCGSTDVRLRPSSGMLICLFCRSEWSAARIEDEFGLGDGIADLTGTVIGSGAADIDTGADTLVTMKCGGCGAEVTVNTENQLGARCHWCRHTLTINEQIPNGAVPDAVLPFRITKDDAVGRIRQFVGKRRLFALKRFKAEFTPENVVGVYLPYMVVDGNVGAEVHGVGEIETRRYTRGTDDNKRTYYDADVYRIRRQVDFTVDDLTLESSADRANLDTRVNTNNIINTILPFDTKNAVRWDAAYLTGFTSEKRDQDVAALQPTLEDRLLSIARSEVADSVRRFGRGVRWEQERLDIRGTRWVAMYLPVWLYSYYEVRRGRGMLHYIAVNARTGETMGSVPVQQWKLLLAALTTGTVLEAIAVAALAVTM